MAGRPERGRVLLKRWKIPAALALCAALLLTQTACTGRELYERLLIHALGVDWDGREYTVTVRSASAPGKEGEECSVCRGETVAQALSTLPASTGRAPFYAHNYLVIFGRACGERGLEDALDFFLRYHNARPTVQLYLAQGEAGEILSFRQEGQYLDISRLQQLQSAQEDTGQAVSVELLEFVNASRRQGSSPVLPVIRLAEDHPQVTETAFFRGNRLAGTLTPRETRGWLAAQGRLAGGAVALEEESFGRVTLALSEGKAKVTGEAREEDPPVFSWEVTLSGDAVAVDGGRDRLSPADYPLLEAALARETEGEIRAALEKTARQGCDVLGLGALLYRRDPEAWQRRAEDWEEILPQCDFRVRVTAHVSRLEK